VPTYLRVRRSGVESDGIMGFPLVNAGKLRRTPCFIVFQYNKQEQRVDDICKLPYLFPFSFQEDVGKDDVGKMVGSNKWLCLIY
jgi:hypothetical protein